MRVIMRQHAWHDTEAGADAHTASARNGTSNTVTRAPAETSLRHSDIEQILARATTDV
jgi:hypothetical protein